MQRSRGGDVMLKVPGIMKLAAFWDLDNPGKKRFAPGDTIGVNGLTADYSKDTHEIVDIYGTVGAVSHIVVKNIENGNIIEIKPKNYE